MNSFRVSVITALAGLVMLAGCGDPQPEPTTPSSATPKPAGTPKAAELSSEMVAAVSAGKNASAIGVHFALGASPSVAKPLPVQIAIVPHQQFATVSAHFESHDGLEMAMGEDFGPVSNVDAEKALSHQLMLVPGKEGMFMVTVSVDTVGEDGNVVRVFSIPVIVGPAQNATASAPEQPAP
jgi:hypothetical protein